MTLESLQKIAVLLRSYKVEDVKQGESLAQVLPLFDVEGGVIQSHAMVEEVFSQDEQRWLMLTWLGCCLKEDCVDLSPVQIQKIFEKDGLITIQTTYPILPDVWDSFGMIGSISLMICAPNLIELPRTLLNATNIDRIDLKEGTVDLSEQWTSLDIRFAGGDFDNLEVPTREYAFEDWRPNQSLLEFSIDISHEDLDGWINDSMCRNYWVYEDIRSTDYGSAGEVKQLFQFGTQRFVLYTANFAHFFNLEPPTVGEGYIEKVFDGPNALVQVQHFIQTFIPSAKDAAEFPHSVHQLIALIPSIDSMNDRLAEGLTNTESKEEYRGKVLSSLQQLERRILAAKSMWSRW